jgi:hypothetical protein
MLDQLDALDRLDARLSSPPVCLFVVFLGNDLTDIASATDADADDTGTPTSSLKDWLFAANLALDQHRMLRRWYVVQWARALAVRRANASLCEPMVERAFALRDRRAPLDRIRRAFELAADRLVSTTVRFRYKPVVVIIPDCFQVDEHIRRDKAARYGVPLSSYDPQQPNRLVAETLAARGIASIDATECLEGRVGQDYVRDTHLTAAGHETVARCVGSFSSRSDWAMPLDDDASR